MCAILDANVAHKVFGRNRPEAGKAFFDWLDSKNGRLVVGGKLLRELDGAGVPKDWLQQAAQAGRVRYFDDREIDNKTEELAPGCRSDDPHIVALARISGARLLYSDDGRLHGDFKNSGLIDNPHGAVYSTMRSGRLTGGQKKLLRRNDLCRA